MYGLVSFRGSFILCLCLSFSDFHVTLPFDNFIMGVLQMLNVAPSQLHQTIRLASKLFALSAICSVSSQLLPLS